MPVPDCCWNVTEDKIPNLREILLGPNSTGGKPDAYINYVDEIKAILVEKLRNNLLRYTTTAMPIMSGVVAGNNATGS